MKQLFKLLALSALTIASSASMAATATTGMSSTAQLSASCIISADPMAFGTITPAATGEATATGTVNYTCSRGLTVVLGVNGGNNASVANRSMGGTAGNTQRLSYQVYTGPGGPIADLYNTAGAVSAIGTGQPQTTTYYGRLNLNQYVKADSYTDRLVVILTY